MAYAQIGNLFKSGDQSEIVVAGDNEHCSPHTP